MENWKPIKNYEDCYFVSDLGRIKSIHYGKERILKESKDKRGYPIVDLRKNTTRWTVHVHKIVAETFLSKEDSKLTVNHKNEIKTDNRLSNLEWLTNKDNHNYGNRNKIVAKKLQKAVLMFDLNLNFIKEFKSISEAVNNGFNHASISLCCNNKRKTHRNYIWKFK